MTKRDLQKTVGKNLLKIRLERNLTREQLAEKVGISTTFYANLECGNKMMSLVTLRKLADALCVSTDSLLYDSLPTNNLKNVNLLLQDKPHSFICFIEKMIRLCISDIPKAIPGPHSEFSFQEGVNSNHECDSAEGN